VSTIFHAMTNFRRFFASRAQQMTLTPAKKKHEYRTHKLFIVTSGGCSNLSDKFYNCSVDIKGSSMAAEDVLESEEAYYLRRTCGRNNARILKTVADEMGLCIPSTMDTCAYDPCEMAVCTTETMINDVQRQKDGRICVLVNCVDSTRIDNGVLCSMHRPCKDRFCHKDERDKHSLT